MFAAVDIGSYELAMKIFEFSSKNGMRQIDYIRHRIDLGGDAFARGKISRENVDELCRVLREFREIMKGYRVVDYRAYGTSAVRETENIGIILDQIRLRTGIRIDVLSNSEQRFLDYKSIASRGNDFEKIIEKGTAILDLGGGSIQISLFDKDTLVTTQNMRLGILRLQELLNQTNTRPVKYEGLLREIIESQLAVFKKLYLKDRIIENIIVVDDYVSSLIHKRLSGTQMPGYVDSAGYGMFMEYMRTHTKEECVKHFDISMENLPLIFVSAVMINCAASMLGAKLIWAPGVTLCDGMAYEYGEKNRLITLRHDFEKDILASAQNISKRYMGSRKRGETLEQICMTVYDSMGKLHGMGDRERLLLRLAALLHDCGKYISLVDLGECSYRIVMATEIIGISHRERKIVANVVKYNHEAFTYFEEAGSDTGVDESFILVTAKLTAILRVANGLDRSHKQKFRDIRTAFKDGALIITVNTPEDITLEKEVFREKAEFFEEVFSIRPVIRQKKLL